MITLLHFEGFVKFGGNSISHNFFSYASIWNKGCSR